jgi:hypothetical protein
MNDQLVPLRRAKAGGRARTPFRMNHDLNKLHPFAFENLVVAIARRVIGPGVVSFGQGPDAGRDALYEGQAQYPNAVECWKGRWIIQAKFHSGKTDSGNQWLLKEVRKEVERFDAHDSLREWPDVWIVASNVDPSGVANTGVYDKAVALIKKKQPSLAPRFHIWGAKTLLDYLNQYQDVADAYRHLLTPGHVIAALLESLTQDKASARDIIHHLIVDSIEEHKNTRLQDAGSKDDTKPGIHELFIDLPYSIGDGIRRTQVAAEMLAAAHQPLTPSIFEERRKMQLRDAAPRANRIWFVKAGPGRGKSTIGQYLGQIWRSAAILEGKPNFGVPLKDKELAKAIKEFAVKRGHWPSIARIPLQVELRDFAQWISGREKDDPHGILSYLSTRFEKATETKVGVGLLKAVFAQQCWFIVFDGLDEVPSELKDEVGREVIRFVENVCHDIECDALFIVTSRPQGYSGQFDGIDGVTLKMEDLSFAEAVECAKPLLNFERTKQQAQEALTALQAAGSSPAVVNLMRTPLQSHIMAIVVRDGHQPPERRWKLFANFYEVIKKREAAKKVDDKILFRLLSHEDKLLKTIHNRTGFVVHARAEKGSGALTSISRGVFDQIVRDAATDLVNQNAEDIASRVSRAATERLVLVNTPDSGSTIRFDVRQLQEFFAGEFLYDSVGLSHIINRLKTLVGDAHWREVVYFAISAFVETNRTEDAWAASKILSELDYSHSRGWARSVTGAMARGGYITLHLAEEGVFEQDKRIREEFTLALHGCDGAMSSSLLGALRFKKDSDTLRWVLDEMLTVIRKGQTMGQFGAMLLLSCYLPDESPLTAEVSNLMTLAELNILDTLLTIRIRNVGRQNPLQHWVVSLAATRMAHQKAADVGWRWAPALFQPGFVQLRPLESANTGKFDGNVAYQFIITLRDLAEEGKLISECVTSVPGREGTARILVERLPDGLENMIRSVIDAGGWYAPGSLFEMVVAACRFACSREPSVLQTILAAEPETRWWVTQVPLFGTELLNHRFIDRLSKGKAGSLAGSRVSNEMILARYSDCFERRLERLPQDLDVEKWVTYCDEELFSAIYSVAENNAWWPRGEAKAFAAVLLKAIEKDKRVIAYFAHYIAELEAVLGSEVRGFMIAATFVDNDSIWMGGEDVKVENALAAIEIPREVALLPGFARRVINICERDDQRRKGERDWRRVIREKIAGWSGLLAMIDNPRCELIYRCAAMCVKVLAEAEESRDDVWLKRMIVELYAANVPTFYIKFVCVWARRVPVERLDLVAGVLGNLLDSGLLSPKHRLDLEQVVEYLRETSFAPISSAQCESAWLTECGRPKVVASSS